MELVIPGLKQNSLVSEHPGLERGYASSWYSDDRDTAGPRVGLNGRRLLPRLIGEK